MADSRRVHVNVSGRVQGVYFRAYTMEEAVKLGLKGWVRNCADGSVEALIEGKRNAVDKMIQWFHEGSPHSSVDTVEITDKQPAGDMQEFTIRY